MENGDPGMSMLQAINSGDVEWCQEAITNFKQFIKRNLVDLSYVSSYMSSLITAYSVKGLSILSFSTLCHLIKRVSIQEPNVLVSVYDPTLPFLIQRLNEAKDSIRLTALKSLKTCIECAPNNDIDLIVEYLLKYGVNINPQNHQLLQLSVLNILYQIVESSNSFTFSFKSILDSIVKLLKTNNEEVFAKCSQILTYYFTAINPTNASAKNDLLNALVNNDIPLEASTKILQGINQGLYNRYMELIGFSHNKHQVEVSKKDKNEQLNDILSKIPNWNIEDINFPDESTLSFENLYPEFELHFNDKETEKNWKYRQSLIIKLRQILRGKDLMIDIESFIHFLKCVKECIVKGMMSLRTTLSNNSCQLCKELGIYIGEYLDGSLVEYLLVNLLKLTPSRKIIQHQNSNVAIVSLLLYTNLSNKAFSLLTSTFHDKNIQPRVYTGNWIQLLLLRYYNSDDMSHFHYFVESVENLIIKGLSDPIPQVKDSMRKAFWTLCELDASYESKITKHLDTLTIRALSRAKGVQPNAGPTRIPIKQLIKQRITSDSNIPTLSNSRNMNFVNNENENVMFMNNGYEFSRKNTRSESLEIKRTTDKKPKLSVRSFTADNINSITSQEPVLYLGNDVNDNVDDNNSNSNNSNSNDKEDDFDDFTGRLKRDNIIYEEITSNSKEQQKDGFNKILKTNETTIAVKFHSALNQLSIVNPDIFNVLFLQGNEGFFRKVSNYVSTENIVRVFCLYLTTSKDYQRIDFIINELSLEDLCLSLVNILSLAINSTTTTNVILSIQFKRNRNSIIDSVLKIFKNLVTIKREMIKSYLLTSLFDSLFVSFQVIDSNHNKNREDVDHELKKEYVEVFKFCVDEFKDVFMNSLIELKDEMTKRKLVEVLELPIVLPDVEKNEEEDTVMTGMGETNESVISSELVEEKKIDGDNIKESENNESMFDFNNLEDKQHIGEMSIGIEEEVVQEESISNEENKENEPVSVNKLTNEKVEAKDEIIEEGTDISMHNESNSFNESLMLNDSSKDSEVDVNNAIMNDANTVADNKEDDCKIPSDSTPDMDTLSINEVVEDDDEESHKKTDELLVEEAKIEIVEEAAEERTYKYSTVDGFLGIIINDLIPDEKNEETKKLANVQLKDLEFNKVDDFSIILYNYWKFDVKHVYDKMVGLLEKRLFVVESLAIIKYTGKIFDINKVIDIFGSLSETEKIDDDILISMYEIMKMFELKKLISIDKMKKLDNKLQEIILRCIFEKMEEDINVIDVEDIFMIERILKRCIDEKEHRGMKMYSYFISKKIYEMHYRGMVDKQGMELVDGYIIDNMSDKVIRYCSRYFQ